MFSVHCGVVRIVMTCTGLGVVTLPKDRLEARMKMTIAVVAAVLPFNSRKYSRIPLISCKREGKG